MKTLGWEVLSWLTQLPSPSDPSQPFVMSDEQARFALAWYSLDDRGQFIYRRGGLQGAKGWGKSPFGAALAIAEFAGPVRFDGWDARGEPVGRPWGTAGDPPAFVQIAATSEEQADSNVYALVWTLLAENDGKAAETLGIDLGRTRLYLKSSPGAKLESVTASWGAREGQRVTFPLMDETHHWLRSNGGHKLARVLRRNAAKMSGRTLELSNAHELGEGSIAEQTCEAAERGKEGLLFQARRPSREPDPALSDAELRKLLVEVYSGSAWIDVDRILRDVRDDQETAWEEALRFYFNMPASGMLVAVEPALWAKCARKDRELVDGERIGLGFDGSHSRDGTALVACTEDGCLIPLEIIERPDDAPDGWTIDRRRIERAVEFAFSNYDVAFLYGDPWRWRDELEEWDRRWPDQIVEFPTNSSRRMAPAVDRFRTGLQEGRLGHNADPDLSRHVRNARLRKIGRDEDGRGTYLLEESGPGRLYDGCVAAVLANEARSQFEEERDDWAPL